MESSDKTSGKDKNENSNIKPLVSIHYPGVVKDVSKMLETLGGIKVISAIYSEKNRRLELRWRPDDSYCKPTFGTKNNVLGLLLKIKIRKKKTEKTGVVLSCEPIGSVTEEYSFCNLCDFQYLATSDVKCYYDTIVPNSLDPDWFNSPAPYFLPPIAFSKIDTVQNFNFSKVPESESKPNVIGRLRGKRYGSAKCMTFDSPEIPTSPKELPAGGIGSAKLINSEMLQHLQSLFQERPIYSKSAIKCISKLSPLHLKCILPCVAYYFSNGPWRLLWIRFGYDPRQDPKARIYQTLDFRVRNDFIRSGIKLKRQTTGSLSHKFTSASGKSAPMCSRLPTETKEKKEETGEDSYIFKPNMIPPSRQCHYQYCDIDLPEVKDMLGNLEDVPESAVCHEVDGWLPSGMADKCRKIMNEYIRKEIEKRKKMQHQIVIDAVNPLSFDSESDFSDSEQPNE